MGAPPPPASDSNAPQAPCPPPPRLQACWRSLVSAAALASPPPPPPPAALSSCEGLWGGGGGLGPHLSPAPAVLWVLWRFGGVGGGCVCVAMRCAVRTSHAPSAPWHRRGPATGSCVGGVASWHRVVPWLPWGRALPQWTCGCPPVRRPEGSPPLPHSTESRVWEHFKSAKGQMAVGHSWNTHFRVQTPPPPQTPPQTPNVPPPPKTPPSTAAPPPPSAPQPLSPAPGAAHPRAPVPRRRGQRHDVRSGALHHK